MVLLWLLDAGTLLLELVVGLFAFTAPLDLPAPPSIDVPTPMVGTAGVAMLNAWWPVAVGTATALAVGRALQWAYQLIPFKAT